MKTENTIKATAADMANKVHNGTDAVQKTVDDTVDSMGKRLGALESLWKEYGDLVVRNAKDLSSAAEKQVRANPLASFGIAFATGLVVARLLRRS